MLELILKGRPRFYLWLCFLGAIFGLGVYGLGGIIVSVLWKIAIDVKKENGTFALKGN